MNQTTKLKQATRYLTKDGQERYFDYLTIGLDIEYLPGKKVLGAPLSVDFIDYNVAQFALAHIQKQIPEARLTGYGMVDDGYPEEYVKKLDVIRKRDAAYRKQYLEAE